MKKNILLLIIFFCGFINFSMYGQSIYGYNVLVQGTNQTYTLTGLTATPSSVTWSVSSNLSIVSGQGTTSIVVSAKNGNCSIESINAVAIIPSGSVNLSTTINMNLPEVKSISGPSKASVGEYIYFTPNVNRNQANVTRYVWEVSNGSISMGGSIGEEVRVVFTSYGVHSVYCRAISTCGEQTISAITKVTVQTPVPPSSSYNFSYSPESKRISVAIDDVETSAINYNYTITNLTNGASAKNGSIGKQGGTIDVNSLSKGMYVFTIKLDDNNVQSEKFVVQ